MAGAESVSFRSSWNRRSVRPSQLAAQPVLQRPHAHAHALTLAENKALLSRRRFKPVISNRLDTVISGTGGIIYLALCPSPFPAPRR